MGLARYDFRIRANGQDWPAAGHTMVGHMRLRNVREALMRVVRDGVVASQSLACGAEGRASTPACC
eukprot:scaffold44215_cov69-Phaeocystis_antarctica.AAC.1